MTSHLRVIGISFLKVTKDKAHLSPIRTHLVAKTLVNSGFMA